MKNRILEFDEFNTLNEDKDIKFIESSVENGNIDVIVDETQITGKQFFGLLNKKKKVRTTYRKNKGYEWFNVTTGKTVWDINKRKQLNKWSDDSRAELKKLEAEKKEKLESKKDKK